MFTGIIAAVGTIVERSPLAGGQRITIDTAGLGLDDVALGDSIAVDGCCLTIVERAGARAAFDVSLESIARTAGFDLGRKVNLEKALRVGDRLGGHWVQGHVDGVADVLEVRQDGGSWRLSCSLPSALAPFFVEKGSVCIDGVSLTLTHVSADRFGVMLIPETWMKTSLSTKGVGAKVNLEADIVGKFVAKMIGARGGLTEEQLRLAGFGR